jgi:hypothetical protein
MVLGFKRRFAPMVRDGSKTHSIREDPNDRWKVGTIVDAFVDPRQKTMERLIPRTPCVKTERIFIRESNLQSAPLRVSVDGNPLGPDEIETLFYRDGFRDKTGETFEATHQAAEFWEGRLPFRGKLIHWIFPG